MPEGVPVFGTVFFVIGALTAQLFASSAVSAWYLQAQSSSSQRHHTEMRWRTLRSEHDIDAQVGAAVRGGYEVNDPAGGQSEMREAEPVPDPPEVAAEPPMPLPPLPLPPLPPLPPSAPQPDELERMAQPVDLQCGSSIPPESIHASGRVHTFARASYKGFDASLHKFAYHVEFKNPSHLRVQLLTRHLIFVDDTGRKEEIKGPGARGRTPIISPGDSWAYDSATRLTTARGSMHGWFTFEELHAEDNGRERPLELFVVPIGRLALSPDNRHERVPCARVADDGKLVPTSVHSTGRVIVGAVVELSTKDADVGMFSFLVDLQVNNARNEPIYIVGYRWELIDANGQRYRTHGRGVGTHDGQQLQSVQLRPNTAMRIRCEMPQLFTSTATIHGVLLAQRAEPAAGASEEASLYLGGQPVSWGGVEPDELIVAPLGASEDGSPVPQYHPLGFLE